MTKFGGKRLSNIRACATIRKSIGIVYNTVQEKAQGHAPLLVAIQPTNKKTLSEGRQTKRKSDKVGGFSMTQKQAYEQLRLQLLFIAEDDVVRTSNFTSGEEGDSGIDLPFDD